MPLSTCTATSGTSAKGPSGIGVGNFGGEVVRGLGGGVDDAGWPEGADEFEDTVAVADVEGVVDVMFERLFETFLVPGSVAAGAEEFAPPVVVEAMDGEAALVKSLTNFRTDQSRRSGNENCLIGIEHESDRLTHRLRYDRIDRA
jgi:hypothetical protein